MLHPKSQSISSFAMRPGRSSADIKGRIRVWSVDPPAEGPLRSFDGPAGLLLLGFNPSGSALVTGHRVGTSYLRSLDLPAFVPPLELVQGHRGDIGEAAFHPNGRWLALGQITGAVLWPLDGRYARVLLREESGGNDSYRGFAFSPDGTWIAAKPHRERPLRRIPLTWSAGEDVVTLTDEVRRRVATVIFDPAGRYLVTGGDQAVFIPQSGANPRELAGFGSAVDAVAVSRDGRLIAAGGGGCCTGGKRVSCMVERTRGFSLIEVIAALILLAVGILGLSAVVAVTGEQTRLAHIRTELRIIGQERMESLLAGGFDDLSDGEDQQRRYEIDWSVVGDDLKEVTLVVAHSQGEAEAADTLATLVSRP